MIFYSFFMEHLKSSHDFAKKNSFKRWIIFLKHYYSHINVPTNWNDYKFFSMTWKVLETDVMVYNMTKNPETYNKGFLVKVLEN